MPGRLRIWVRLRLEELRFRLRELVRRPVRKLVEMVLTDLDLMRALREVTSSADFERDHLGDAARFKNRVDYLRHVLAQVPDGDGLFLELGVYKGDSINRLAGWRRDVHWYGFDTFTGLPDTWNPGARKGAFDVGGTPPPVLENVSLVQGAFEQTLAPFAAQHRGETIRFMHVDCDLYSATCTIFATLGPMLGPGCIIAFDDFINYPGWQDGEYKGFMEFIRTSGRSFEYIAYVRTGAQVAVRIV